MAARENAGKGLLWEGKKGEARADRPGRGGEDCQQTCRKETENGKLGQYGYDARLSNIN